MSDIWQGLIGDNLASVGDIVECASVTEFEVVSVIRSLSDGWLYTLKNTVNKNLIAGVNELDIDKINGIKI